LNIQVALAGMPEIELDAAAIWADRIMEATLPHKHQSPQGVDVGDFHGNLPHKK
jgi:hypothetical protein